MTAFDADELERNWLWLGIDAAQQVAAFQTSGNGALPIEMLSSVEDAELVDQYIVQQLIAKPGRCAGHLRAGYETYSWRATFPDAKYEQDWQTFLSGSVRVASCGVFVYHATGKGYYQIAFPSSPLLADSLPTEIVRIARRATFPRSNFAQLLQMAELEPFTR